MNVQCDIVIQPSHAMFNSFAPSCLRSPTLQVGQSRFQMNSEMTVKKKQSVKHSEDSTLAEVTGDLAALKAQLIVLKAAPSKSFQVISQVSFAHCLAFATNY